MPRNWSRRDLLHAAGTIGATTASTSLAGCFGTGMPADAEIATDRVDDVHVDATVLHTTDLPAAETTLLETAAAEGLYHECEVSHAMRSFADRIEGGPGSTYLEHDDTRFGLWVRITDVVYANTAGPPDPEDRPDCSTGLFDW